MKCNKCDRRPRFHPFISFRGTDPKSQRPVLAGAYRKSRRFCFQYRFVVKRCYCALNANRRRMLCANRVTINEIYKNFAAYVQYHRVADILTFFFFSSLGISFERKKNIYSPVRERTADIIQSVFRIERIVTQMSNVYFVFGSSYRSVVAQSGLCLCLSSKQ